MNRRDLLKALSAIIPASWMAKLSPSEQEITYYPGTWITSSDGKTVDVVYVAGEDLRRGDVVSLRNGGRAVKASTINYLCNGVCTHDAKSGKKCLVRIAGPVDFVRCV